MTKFDKWTEKVSRRMASTSSRRGFFTKVAGLAIAGAAFPTLPIIRASAQENDGAKEERGVAPIGTGMENDPGDITACDYWRYCGIDGNLCSCCGGSHNTCPPGTEMSQIAWVGTCRNPSDNRNYIISYNDCCGGPTCENCFCVNSQSDRPVTRPQSNNDIIWCFGTESQAYTCTVGIVLGVALDD